jgi:hypothetical protein
VQGHAARVVGLQEVLKSWTRRRRLGRRKVHCTRWGIDLMLVLTCDDREGLRVKKKKINPWGGGVGGGYFAKHNHQPVRKSSDPYRKYRWLSEKIPTTKTGFQRKVLGGPLCLSSLYIYTMNIPSRLFCLLENMMRARIERARGHRGMFPPRRYSCDCRQMRMQANAAQNA